MLRRPRYYSCFLPPAGKESSFFSSLLFFSYHQKYYSTKPASHHHHHHQVAVENSGGGGDIQIGGRTSRGGRFSHQHHQQHPRSFSETTRFSHHHHRNRHQNRFQHQRRQHHHRRFEDTTPDEDEQMNSSFVSEPEDLSHQHENNNNHQNHQDYAPTTTTNNTINVENNQQNIHLNNNHHQKKKSSLSEVEKLQSLPEGKHKKVFGIGDIDPLNCVHVNQHFQNLRIPCFPQFAETTHYLITWLDVPVLKKSEMTDNNSENEVMTVMEQQHEIHKDEKGFISNQIHRYEKCDFVRAVGACPKKLLGISSSSSSSISPKLHFEIATELCWMHAIDIIAKYSSRDHHHHQTTSVSNNSATTSTTTSSTIFTAFVLKHHQADLDRPYPLPIPSLPHDFSPSLIYDHLSENKNDNENTNNKNNEEQQDKMQRVDHQLKQWSKYTTACAEFSDALFLRKQQETILAKNNPGDNHLDPTTFHFANYTLNTNCVAESLLLRILEDERLKPASYHTHQRIADIDHFVLHALEKNGVVTNHQHLAASGNLCYVNRETRLPYCVTFPVPWTFIRNNDINDRRPFFSDGGPSFASSSSIANQKWVCKMVVPPLHSETQRKNSFDFSSSFPRAASQSNCSIFPEVHHQTHQNNNNHLQQQNFLFALGHGETPERAKVLATLHCLRIVKEKARLTRLQKAIINADHRAKMTKLHIAHQERLEKEAKDDAANKSSSTTALEHQQQQQPPVYVPAKIFSGAKRLINLYSTLMSKKSSTTSSPSTSEENESSTSATAQIETSVTHEKCTTHIRFCGIEVTEHGLSRDESEARAFSALFEIAVHMLPGLAEIEKLCEKHPELDTEDIISAHFDKSTLDRIHRIKQLMGEPTKEDLEAEDGRLSPELRMERAALRLHSHLRSYSSSTRARQERAERMKTQLLKMRSSNSYKKYYEESRSKLPMAMAKDELMKHLDENRVIVISGTTGCGKTTQVPQYLLDHHIERGEGPECSILVTQPRRISAISISERIAAERCEPVGDSTGYTIRLDSNPGKNITLLTTGVLLQLLRVDPALKGVKYLIIDEIHERDLHCDFSLILAKEALRLNPELRLICMSATLQSDTFSKYFDGAPVINVDGMLHPVQEFYLEDLPKLANKNQLELPMFDGDQYIGNQHHNRSYNRRSSASSSFFHNHLRHKADSVFANEDELNQFELSAESDSSLSSSMNMPSPEKIDAQLVATTIELASREIPKGTSILVFVPGWKEITQVQSACQKYCESAESHEYIFLHSSVTKDQQLMAFRPVARGRVKIVIATNIAESGVTISDVGAVVDCGLIREMSCIMRQGTSNVGKNEAGSVFRLRTSWASKANLTQRRGRAGRTRGGLCFRLYTKDHFEKTRDFQTPEMLRQPLESVILQSIAMGHGKPEAFFAKALDPPPARLLEHSIRQLRALGAIHDDFKLTWLGQWLVKMPTEPATAKMILLGAMLGCLDPILTVAAAADAPPLVTAMNLRGDVRKAKRDVGMWSLSDSVADAVVVNSFFGVGHPQPPLQVQQQQQQEPRSDQSLESKPSSRLNLAIGNSSSAQRRHFVPSHLYHRNNLKVLSRYKQQFFDVLASSGWNLHNDYDDDEGYHYGDDDVANHHQHQPPVPHHSYFVDYSPASKNARETELVKAVIAAGNYPKVAVLSSSSSSFSANGNNNNNNSKSSSNNNSNKTFLRTKLRSNITVSSHCILRGLLKNSKKDLLKTLVESSRNAEEQNRTEEEVNSLMNTALSSPIFVYENVTDIGGQEFIENVSHTNLWAILLLAAGNDHIMFNEDLNLGVIDGWILFKTDKETIQALRDIREVLNTCFGRLLRANQKKKSVVAVDQNLTETFRVLDQVRSLVKDVICGK